VKTIITATVIAMFTVPALADDRPSTAKHLACVEAEAAKLPPNPLTKSDSLTKDELTAQFGAYVDKETAAMQRCFSEKDVRLLAEANYLVGLATSRCGGGARNKEVIELGQGSRVPFFGRHEDAIALEYKATIDRMNADPDGPVVARFCQGVTDRFGPKGVDWSGLYVP
jgi:hypothetical protein